MAQPRIATSYLELLPLELISMIFENIGHDLVAHVTFSKLRPDIYEFCYKNRGRGFWEPILRASGLSTLELSEHDLETDASLSSRGQWEKLARECVAHAETCKHPRCGMPRLRENEELMRASISSGIALMRTLDASDEVDKELLWELPDYPKFNSTMDIITFKTREHAANLPIETWRDAAFIRHEVSDAEQDDSLQYDDEFVHHPILWRSFFVFPPIAGFCVTSTKWDRAIAPRNADGVILADVLQNIVEIDQSFGVDASGFLDLYEYSDLEREDEEHSVIIPQSWGLTNTLRALENFRNWFKIVRWVGLEVNEIDRNEIFCTMHFKAQKLPDSYKDFVRFTEYSHKPQP